MRRLTWFLAGAILMMGAASAFAHGDHAKSASTDAKSASAKSIKSAKCSYDAQTCLNHWSAKKDKGWMGAELDHNASEQMVIKKVMDGSPAAEAGFLAGDILLARNGIKMADYEAQKADKDSWKVGANVTYTIQREGAEKTIPVTLAAIPAEVYARMLGDHMITNHMTAATAAATTNEKAK